MPILCRISMIALFLNLGCATVQGRHRATAYDPQGQVSKTESTPSGLVVSSDELTDYASEQFGLVAVTFENRTKEWRHLESLSVDFGSARRNDLVRLPWGDDLESWLVAAQQKRIIERTRIRNSLALLAIGGAVTGALADRGSGVAQMGGGVAAVALTASFLSSLEASARPRLPLNHLLAGSVAVPPGLFAKRWIVIQTPGDNSLGCVSKMHLTYRVAELQAERVTLVLREPTDHSTWQAAACETASRSRQGDVFGRREIEPSHLTQELLASR